jgi:hypothetical protein
VEELSPRSYGDTEKNIPERDGVIEAVLDVPGYDSNVADVQFDVKFNEDDESSRSGKATEKPSSVSPCLRGEGSVATGIRLRDGRTIGAQAVIITTGTFLNGLIHCGEQTYPA